MKLSTQEIYNLVYKSFTESPEDWKYSDHHHKHINGIGIPFDIENEEIGVSIWIANGPSHCKIKVPPKTVWEGDRVHIKEGFEVSGIGYFKRRKLYKAAQLMIVNNSTPGWEIPVSKRVIRDSKINDVLS